MKFKPLICLQALLYFIAMFHLIMGLGLMFSIDFQHYMANLYTNTLSWELKDIYYTRIIGSFAFVLGTLAIAAARNPLKYAVIIIAFSEFFILRNINRHLYANELYKAFSVSPVINFLTTVFFMVQAISLLLLLWLSYRENKDNTKLI